jgi:HemY protein
MRGVVWLVVLFAAAVAAATALGSNDGLVSVYWHGWRTDLSLNLAVLLLSITFVLLWLAGQAATSLSRLPERARQWRETKRSAAAQAALREAQAEYLAARYSRAQRAAQRALDTARSTIGLESDVEFNALAHLLAAGSAHRLQDKPQRERWMSALAKLPATGPAAEGAALQAAEWALDDNDAAGAARLLADLPAGVARRTLALRLRLRSARLNKQPEAALQMARQLAKHQAFSASAAAGLLRTLAIEALETARDAEQLRRVWQQLDAADRRDAWVCARAAQRAVSFGAHEDARAWLRPHWDALGALDAQGRAQLGLAMMLAAPGVGTDWLPRLEAAAQRYPDESAVQAAVGAVLFERQLWGRALRALEPAAQDKHLAPRARRLAWRLLAALAKESGQVEREQFCVFQAAQIE